MGFLGLKDQAQPGQLIQALIFHDFNYCQLILMRFFLNLSKCYKTVNSYAFIMMFYICVEIVIVHC